MLAPGSDADIVVYDPKADHVIRAEDMAGAADYNPYEGFVTKGSIRQVWLRGKPVVSSGKVLPGSVNFILCRLIGRYQTAEELQEVLMPYHILIRQCGNYEGLDETYFRVAVRTEEENRILMEALRAVEKD